MTPPHKNIGLLNVYNILLAFIPTIAVIIPFYQHQIGLSFQDFLIAEAAFASVVVAMEIPSGWLADIWRRKSTLALGAAINTAGFILLGCADSFMDAVMAQSLIGVGVSLCSGTPSAMLYDTLLEQGREAEYRKYEGKRNALGLYSIGLSSVLGGFLYVWDPYLPVWVSAATYFLCVPVALMLREPGRHKEEIHKNPFHDMVRVLRYALRENRELAALMFFVAFLYGSTQAGMWMQQAYFIALEIPEMWFGVLVSLGFLIGGIGSHLGHFLEKYLRPVKILALLWAAVIVSWTLSGAVLWYHALGLLLISNAAWGIGFPVMQDAINRRVDSSRRATVLSVASLMMRLVFIPLGFVIGWVADAYGVSAGFLALAGFVLTANILNLRKLLI